jgi:hypothetical protein
MSKYIDLEEIVDCQDHTDYGIDVIIPLEYDLQDFADGYGIPNLTYADFGKYVNETAYLCECCGCELYDENDECECGGCEGDCNSYNKEQIETSRATLEYIQNKEEKELKEVLNNVFIPDIFNIIDMYIDKQIKPRTIYIHHRFFHSKEDGYGRIYKPELFVFPSRGSSDINLGYNKDKKKWFYTNFRSWLVDDEYNIDESLKVPDDLRVNLITDDTTNALIVNRFYND